MDWRGNALVRRFKYPYLHIAFTPCRVVRFHRLNACHHAGSAECRSLSAWVPDDDAVARGASLALGLFT
jgi:hypothetical protein